MPCYVWRRWLGPLAIATLAILGILFLETLHGAVPDWLQRKTPAGTVLAYHLLLLPGRLPIAFPAAVFVASLFTLGRLCQGREILAMRAAGLSPWAIVRWIRWSTLAIAAALLLLHCFPIALAEDRASAIWEATHGPSLSHPIAYDGHRGRLWLLGQLDGNGATSAFVVEMDPATGPRHIRAERASFRNGTWSFFQVWERDGSAILSGRQPPFFAEKIYPTLVETPREMRLAQRRVRDLSFRDLRHLLRPIPPGDAARIPYALRLHSLAAGCASVPVALLCALPFTLAGAPRRGSLLAASQATACLFAFFLLNGLCQVLGLGRAMPPAVAAWLPNALAGATALYFFHRRT